MIAYVLRRFLAAVPVLLGVSLVVFSMLHFLPGDPVLLMMSETGGSGAKMADVSQETYERIRHELGLDRPLPVQFVIELVEINRRARTDFETADTVDAAFAFVSDVRIALFVEANDVERACRFAGSTTDT